MAKLRLKSSHDEAGNIRTFVFETAGVIWQAGQYQTYELEQVTGSEDARRRFFTIASAPSENEIHISTRISGSPFKQALNAMQPGDSIVAHDLEGDFTWESDAPVVLVAGGIGVTPFRSMLLERARLGKPLNARLVYFGRDDDFAFREEFDRLAAEHSELKIEYLVGEKITADNILRHATQAKEQTLYLSGAEPMVEAVGEDLKRQGVELKQDWFPGYDEQTY